MLVYDSLATVGGPVVDEACARVLFVVVYGQTLPITGAHLETGELRTPGCNEHSAVNKRVVLRDGQRYIKPE